MIFGCGVALSEFIKIHNQPYLVSHGVNGWILQDMMKQHPDQLNQLDPISTSQAIVIAMLINPEDGKPDNYFIQPSLDGGPPFRIVAIDNDHSFGDTVAKQGSKITVEVKSVLFCLDQMMHPIHPTVRDKIIRMDVATVLMNWLRELSSINKCMFRTLF
jgi:hypothetical protein